MMGGFAKAVAFHATANFRGKKPIFKWNSATPWAEMQLSEWGVRDESTLPQILKKLAQKVAWGWWLAKCGGFCIKNYYILARRATKRTTMYAGNEEAFEAELIAGRILKQNEKDEKESKVYFSMNKRGKVTRVKIV